MRLVHDDEIGTLPAIPASTQHGTPNTLRLLRTLQLIRTLTVLNLHPLQPWTHLSNIFLVSHFCYTFLMYGLMSLFSFLLPHWSVERFMTQDKSHDYASTWDSLDCRLRDVKMLGGMASSVGSYLDFTKHSVMDVLRSKSIIR
ncbi:hypothetical protein BDZ91DRAFT_386206 [Kalaharituber pfeilii]|nr:hypothetical protein BDZ91DRAFT_386206 [Kalaharituber pfeilii]